MSFEVPRRSHIVPMGYEKKRVYGPAIKLNADEVVIISHVEDEDPFERHYSEVKEILESNSIDVEHKECDIFDVYDSLRVIGEEITKRSEEEVFVNVSSGSKITAIAGMIASMTSGATPYYVRAMDYSGETPDELGNIIELPKYHIDRPSRDHLAVLEYLRTEGPVTKGEMIKFSEEFGLDFLSDFKGQEKAKYRRLDNHIIDPLSERGYIDVWKDGREKLVNINEAGKNVRNAFVHLSDRQMTLSESFNSAN